MPPISLFLILHSFPSLTTQAQPVPVRALTAWRAGEITGDGEKEHCNVL